MPYILQRLEYYRTPPSIGVIDTDSGYSEDIELCAGQKVPGIAFWTDRRYCRCGSRITKPSSEEEFDPILTVNLNYMCPSCAKSDQLNSCTINGVWRDNKWRVSCHRCYKWSSECANGFCVYIAMLNSSQTELKVGITRLGRKNQRAAEAGYSLMGILMPEGRNSLSLPEAEFLEKRVLSGQTIGSGVQALKINERFSRDIGMVGSDQTRKLTYDALLTYPTETDRGRFSEVLERVVRSADARCSSYMIDPEARELTPLTIAEIIEGQGFQVERAEFEKFAHNDLAGIDSQVFRGRRYRRIPDENRIIAVKGPCLVMETKGRPVVFRMNKHSVAGREIFDPKKTIDLGKASEETDLDWY